MGIAIAVVFLVLLLVGAAGLFLRADPSELARSLKLAGPLFLAVVAVALALSGKAAFAAPLIAAALGAYFWLNRKPAGLPKPAPRHAMVRTAALEMELDHRTGALEGIVLAGRHDGRALGAMDLPELLALYGELSSDGESRRLLEAYLDGRFPVWRRHAKANGGERLGIAPGSGAMTKEEAYKILGLEAGAPAADVRKAHRRLMQRLQPGVGGGSLLAARINEAKDVLLSNHN